MRPTAIYSNPVLLDLIDREMKTEFNVVLNTVEITGWAPREGADHAGWRAAADSGLGDSVHAGIASGTYPAYIVTEDLIEYHWLSDPNPRVFKLGLPNALTQQMVVVKFGAPVVKGANFAHYQVNVQR